MNQKTIFPTLLAAFFIIMFPSITHGIETSDTNIWDKRMALYKKTEAVTLVPWYYLAAVDQYERNTKTNPSDDLTSIRMDPLKWYGAGNLTQSKDTDSIAIFNGQGRDGNRDEKADHNNPEDVLYTLAVQLKQKGPTEADIKRALWDYYKRDLTVHTIHSTAQVFKHFNTIKLKDRDFPLDTDYNYSYQNTWGDKRGFGGLRIHEGTDIFADYGVPVKSTTYGVVELKGWNLYGGWRIGIRDINNIYHYYAHMSGYEDGIEVGSIVQPGDQLGRVGSTGYGPPGTSGKFPPHLHYGMYKDDGESEWSFDPFPYLKKWERMTTYRQNAPNKTGPQ